MVLHDTPIYRQDWNDTEFTVGKGVYIVSLSILNVFMLLGNTLSIVTIVTSKSLRRLPSYWFVLNLSFTDTMIAVTVVPLNTVWEYYGIWPLGTRACKFITFADNSFSTISAYSIVLVSIDKYLFITHAIHYHHHMSKRLASILILGVWIFVSGFSSVSIFAGILSSHFEEDEVNSCIFVMKDSHAVAAAILSFFVPLAILSFTTSRIICIGNRHLQRIRATQSFSLPEEISECIETMPRAKVTQRNSISVFPHWNTGLTLTDLTNTAELTNTLPSRKVPIALKCEQNNNLQPVPKRPEGKRQHGRLKTIQSCPSLHINSPPRPISNRKPFCKLFGTVTIVITFFILMFAPYYITLMIDVGCHCIHPWLYEDILTVLCHSHALVNPYIYILTDKKYKAAFKQMLKKLCRLKNRRNVNHN